jgi:type II secretion system protein G
VKRSLIAIALLAATFLLLTVNIECGLSGDSVKRVAAKMQIDAFKDALDAFRQDTGTYPTNEEGLDALREAPRGIKNWQGPYLPRPIPRNPWGHAYGYRYPGINGGGPEVFSRSLR